MDEIVIAAKNSVSSLIFLFHGYGADNSNLHSLGKCFSEAKPDAEIHIPNGMEFCSEGSGRMWFPLSGDMNHWGLELQKAAPEIMEYVDQVKDSRNLSYQDIIFSGFSQGAMISLTLGVYYNIKAVIGFSGVMLSPEVYLKPADTKVFITHGSQDDLLPSQLTRINENILKTAGIKHVEAFICPGIAHAIGMPQLERAIDFLKNL